MIRYLEKVRTNKLVEGICFLIMLAVIAVVTVFPHMSYGIQGWYGDMMYHILRIESVKEALSAWSYPARINPFFFHGYGYGSSLFYPDIILVIPALMRIIGLSPVVSWKLFMTLLAAAGTCTTYWSFRYISGNWKYSCAGTFLLMLSQFYLADLNNRNGISEYMACIFVPVLLAGIYDYFAREGRKVYLFGIAFVGLVLSHTIMMVGGLLITMAIFLVMLFLPSKRKVLFERQRFIRLLATAALSVLTAAYYIFPMVEQTLNDEFNFERWGKSRVIGSRTQTFASFFNAVGTFDMTAYVGIGIPILILLGYRLILGKSKNKWADFFMFGGLLIFLGTTDLIPWKVLERTFLNSFQFTYRFYPYALCCTILGIVLYLSEKCAGQAVRLTICIAIMSVIFGIWENKVSVSDYIKIAISYDTLMENTDHVGQGEWLPARVGEMETPHTVQEPDGEQELVTCGYNRYSFYKDDNIGGVYKVSLTYYKGYKADMILVDGSRIELEVDESDDCFVEVMIPDELSGTVEIRYAGTTVQYVSNLVSLITVLSIIGWNMKRALDRRNTYVRTCRE